MQIDFDNRTVIDNFLPEEQFEQISSFIVNTRNSSSNLSFFPQDTVASYNEDTPLWSWYATHMFYNEFRPFSSYYDNIGQTFWPLFTELNILRAVIRVKANMFPYTSEVKTHPWHKDFNFDNYGAVFSLNTCDGFTLFKDGMKVDSVANRIVFFNAQDEHCSSTTSNQYARFNINFNFL
jgi:hypothetical protein